MSRGRGVQFNLKGEIFRIMDLIFHPGSFVSAQNQQRQSGRLPGRLLPKGPLNCRPALGELWFSAAGHYITEQVSAQPMKQASRRVIARGGAGSSPSCLLINEQFKRVADLPIDLLNKLIKPINLFQGVAQMSSC